MATAELLSHRLSGLLAQLHDPWQLAAMVAAALAAVLIVVSTFVKTIVPLRWLAVASNLGFVVYGALHPALLILALHATLLPLNLWRVVEVHRLTRRVQRAAAAGSEVQVWLRPYMRRRRLRPGAVLFRQGDLADRLYFLASGRLEVVEKHDVIDAGRMFGEIAFFTSDGRRTATVRCLEPSVVLSIDEVTFKQLLFQNPAFGFEVVRLLAANLGGEVQRLRRQAEPTPPHTPPHTPPPA